MKEIQSCWCKMLTMNMVSKRSTTVNTYLTAVSYWKYFNLRGFVVQWRIMERNETLCFDKSERLWNGEKGM